MALGRLASYSDDLAEAIVQNEILPQLVRSSATAAAAYSCHSMPYISRNLAFYCCGSARPASKNWQSTRAAASCMLLHARSHAFLLVQVNSLSTQNRFNKRSSAFCLRAVAKHSPELANAVAAGGAIPGLASCLEDLDCGVREGAAWALGYIASPTPELAQQVRHQTAQCHIHRSTAPDDYSHLVCIPSPYALQFERQVVGVSINLIVVQNPSAATACYQPAACCVACRWCQRAWSLSWCFVRRNQS